MFTHELEINDRNLVYEMRDEIAESIASNRYAKDIFKDAKSRGFKGCRNTFVSILRELGLRPVRIKEKNVYYSEDDMRIFLENKEALAEAAAGGVPLKYIYRNIKNKGFSGHSMKLTEVMQEAGLRPIQRKTGVVKMNARAEINKENYKNDYEMVVNSKDKIHDLLSQGKNISSVFRFFKENGFNGGYSKFTNFLQELGLRKIRLSQKSIVKNQVPAANKNVFDYFQKATNKPLPETPCINCPNGKWYAARSANTNELSLNCVCRINGNLKDLCIESCCEYEELKDEKYIVDKNMLDILEEA